MTTTPPPVDHLASARATRANLEMLGPDAYGQNASVLIAEAQLDATIAVAEALRVLAIQNEYADRGWRAAPSAAIDTIETWGEVQ